MSGDYTESSYSLYKRTEIVRIFLRGRWINPKKCPRGEPLGLESGCIYQLLLLTENRMSGIYTGSSHIL